MNGIERQILACYVAGYSNEGIVDRFGICEMSAEAYRASLMRKLGASNLIELLVRACICTLAVSSNATRIC